MQTYHLTDVEAPTADEQASNVWRAGEPIVIDFGSANTRVGMADQSAPAHVFASQSARFKDRKTGEPMLFVGNDIFRDQAAIQNAKPTHDAGVVVNWDSVETVFDYAFENLGVSSQGAVNSPLVVSELFAGPHGPRRQMSELLFEGYGVPKAAFGIDALYAFRLNAGANATGIVINCGNEYTTIIPVIAGTPSLADAKRISWGGRQSGEFLQQLLALKYPSFPTRVTPSQALSLFKEHAYVSHDFQTELTKFVTLEGLASRERIVQAPVPQGKPEKTPEELAAIAERRKESGRRLQEQALKARLEKIAYYESELDRLMDVDTTIFREIRYAGFQSAQEVERTIRKTQKTLRALQSRDGTVEPEEEAAPPEFPLADVPDNELDPESLKEKRRQKLMRGNYEARMRAKQEKLEQKQRLEEIQRKDAEYRESDLAGWIKDKRDRLRQLLQNSREREKLKFELNDRKSLASKMRMKSIAVFALNGQGQKRKRLGNGNGNGNDNGADEFGDDEDEQDTELTGEALEEQEAEEINALQQQLLEFDVNFSPEDMEAEKSDWRQNSVHLFLYGAHPLVLESAEQASQLNLNIERIRVPEVLFQPQIAGIDQAGITEIVSDMLNRRFPEHTTAMAQNIVLTGGLSKLPGIADRVARDLMASLPTGSALNVRVAADPIVDAWNGMAQWSRDPSSADAFISKRDYLEHGSDYIKPHSMGNVY